ncbi:glycosyl transferase [Synergistales bacterium]|nr:glycosyl transferase [Synergistales bacterium]
MAQTNINIRADDDIKLIIQIPCYNEEKSLPTTIGALPRHIDGVDKIEFLVIDDGSRDDTVNVARRLGVDHIVSLKKNSGLAVAFVDGLDACLSLGADIIVNTDADNQYCADDIEKLVRPILDGQADIVIGARAVENTEHFSWLKKKLQRLGSRIVRYASNTDIPDAPSGFRAFSRDAAMRINVISEYTYTLETIIQAGRRHMAIISVPIRTNAPMRESRLFKSMWQYIKRSMLTIIRVFTMYKPMTLFMITGVLFFAAGFLIGLRYLLYLFFAESPGAHVQSLLLSVAFMLIGVQTVTMAMLADLISANRKILEDVQYRVKKMFYGQREKYHKKLIK